MKKIFMLAFSLCLTFALCAQDKGQNLALSVSVDNLVEPFPTNAKVQVENKLNALLTQNGILTQDPLNRFVLTVVAIPQQTEVMPTAPAQVAQIIDFTLYIVDAVDKRIYATTTFTAKGLGTDRTRCYQDAVKHINLQSNELKRFIADGKTKIVDWYDTQATRLFMEAKAAAEVHRYEKALSIVCAFPVDSKYYNEALSLIKTYWREYTNYRCDQLLAESRAIWAATQNQEAARAIALKISEIEPDAQCRPEVDKLITDIRSRVREDVELEFRQYTDKVDLEKQRIDAAREVGVAFGKGQQPNTTNFVR